MQLSTLARGVVDLIYPPSCLSCHRTDTSPDQYRHGFCPSCYRELIHDPASVCPWCATTVGPHSDLTDGCTSCRGVSLGFDAAVRLGPYEDRLRECVIKTKSHRGEPVAELLGRILAEERRAVLLGWGVDAVVPIPLHWRRRWVRGYNQSEAIACEVAAALDIPFAPHRLRRRRTPDQRTQPSATARRQNIRGAFEPRRNASPAHRTVLLVDDVMTTGATAGEAARVLKRAGAQRVVVAVVARR